MKHFNQLPLLWVLVSLLKTCSLSIQRVCDLIPEKRVLIFVFPSDQPKKRTWFNKSKPSKPMTRAALSIVQNRFCFAGWKSHRPHIPFTHKTFHFPNERPMLVRFKYFLHILKTLENHILEPQQITPTYPALQSSLRPATLRRRRSRFALFLASKLRIARGTRRRFFRSLVQLPLKRPKA